MKNGIAAHTSPPGRHDETVEPLTVGPQNADELPVAKGMEWLMARLGRIPSGASLLLSGDPGVGKSALGLQLAAAVATAGKRVLYLATEQSAESIHRRLDQLCVSNRAKHHLVIKDDLYDLALLPQLFTHQLVRSGSDLHGTRFVVIDSLHGCGGVSPHDKRTWGAILDYLRQASGAGITSLALAHMTKGNAIAGPRTLEHACDATLLLRYGALCRALIIPKNRFAPAQPDPLGLIFNADTTRLEPSPFGAASTARASTIGADGIVDIEVAITPVRGDRGFIKSPGLSRNEIETVVDLVERSIEEAKSLWAMGITVRAPDGLPHRRDYNLAVAVALMSALRRMPCQQGLLFVGDLGLRGEIRPPSPRAMAALEDAQAAGALSDVVGIIASAALACDAPVDIKPPLHRIATLHDARHLLEQYRS